METSAEAHSDLGVILKNLSGQLEAAKESFSTAIRLDKQLVKAHFNLGNVLWALGKLDDSEASFMQALALKPKIS